jgi:sigma-B regulation protein RsbU (phosphoserine phosphatase)
VLEKERLDQQLRVARDVQSSLLPAASPELRGYEFAAVNLPSWAVGGDYYDYLPLPDGRLGVVIADVSGKGVPAALIMATFRAALRAEASRGLRIPEIAGAVNRILLESPGLARFVTAVYGVLEPLAGRFDYVNCGHNAPMLLHAQGGRESLETGGPALGILSDGAFESASVAIAPGDALVLYTDGVVEPEDEQETEFGTDRLEAILRESRVLPAARMVDSVLEATRLFSGRQRYEDDFTLVVVKRLLNGR